MSRYASMFARLEARGEGALIPFLMLGDPGASRCLSIIDSVVASGADALELGLPFSDPTADGPTLVAAANRALGAGMTTGMAFELLAQIRQRHPSVPIGVLAYANPVFARGLDDFHAHAARAGVDSVLVPDLPLREATPFTAAATRHGIDQVFILPPDAGDATMAAVAAASRGYTYVLGRRGVTGEDQSVELPPPERLAALRCSGAPPPVIGFGISKPAHVRTAMAAGAAGVIVGSALVNAIVRGKDPGRMVRALKAATRVSRDDPKRHPLLRL